MCIATGAPAMLLLLTTAVVVVAENPAVDVQHQQPKVGKQWNRAEKGYGVRPLPRSATWEPPAAAAAAAHPRAGRQYGGPRPTPVSGTRHCPSSLLPKVV